MRWNLTIVFLMLLALVSYGLYQLSYEVQQLEKDVAAVRAKIANNQETIRILKAEWSYQNRPENLQAMARSYLPLLLVAPYQVTKAAYLPELSEDPFSAAYHGIPTPRKRPRYIPRQRSSPLVLATFRGTSPSGAGQ